MSRCIGSGPKAREEGPWKNISRNVGRLLLLFLPLPTGEGWSQPWPSLLPASTGCQTKIGRRNVSKHTFQTRKKFHQHTSVYVGVVFLLKRTGRKRVEPALAFQQHTVRTGCSTEMDTKGELCLKICLF